jgi:hypothetical protein
VGAVIVVVIAAVNTFGPEYIARGTVDATHYVKVRVLKIHASVNDRHIHINPEIIGAVNSQVCIGIGENALDARGMVWAKAYLTRSMSTYLTRGFI